MLGTMWHNGHQASARISYGQIFYNHLPGHSNIQLILAVYLTLRIQNSKYEFCQIKPGETSTPGLRQCTSGSNLVELQLDSGRHLQTKRRQPPQHPQRPPR